MVINMENNIYNVLIKLANKASKKGEVPVSAIIVKNNKIIAKSYNKREKNSDILGHAEIRVIRKASKKLKTWKLDNCCIYVSLKPCSMCEKIIKESRIRECYYLVDKLNYKKEYNCTKFTKKSELSTEELLKQILRNFFEKKRK